MGHLQCTHEEEVALSWQCGIAAHRSQTENPAVNQATSEFILNRVKNVTARCWPYLLLVIVNIATFRSQFSGDATFPWDFLGGYHTQAFGWYENGGVFAPPTWFPWTSLGFPSFLALQSSAWYFPLILMRALDLPYTIHAATVLQVLHVLLGATGIYCLARRLGGGLAVALMLALGYHFSVTFYSNQEHVDIVRAAAWFPWLLYTLHPAGFLNRRANLLIAPLLISQFLICAYPGNIVTAVYSCLIWVSMWCLDGRCSSLRKSYLFCVSSSVLCGTLLAMPKWLPLLINGSSGLQLAHYPPSVFEISSLFTIFTPYDVAVLPGDITMRSIWLPLTCVWGACYASLRMTRTRIGLVLIGIALFVGISLPHLGSLSVLFPGTKISRFPLSDWRPVLHVGFILVSLDGWTNFLTGARSAKRSIHAGILALVIGLFVTYCAFKFGFDMQSLVRVELCFVVMMIASTLFLTVATGDVNYRRYAYAWCVFLIIATFLDGYQYQISQPRTWLLGWSKQIEVNVFGENIDSVIRHPRIVPVIDRRPRRMLIGKDQVDALAQQNSPAYNKCWYHHSYCVFGYDSMKLSLSHEILLKAAGEEGGAALLDFVARPQTLFALEPGASQLVPVALDGDDASVIGSHNLIDVGFVRYGADSVTYRVTALRDIRIVENEIWWPGWHIEACRPAGCETHLEIGPTPQGLRSWRLEKGTWDVRVQFSGPSMIPGFISALIGLLGSVFCFIFLHRALGAVGIRPSDDIGAALRG